jgi:electron transport complex protein RnfC
MSALKTFPMGGIHPPEEKITAESPIQVLPLPREVTILLGQHLGKPAAALVKPGDKVKAGSLLAKADGFISANVHSSVSGTVKRLATAYDMAGFPRQAVIIAVEGDEWEEGVDRSEGTAKALPEETPDINTRLLEMGVVGLGGATFPTNVKYSLPPGKTADTLIINAVECEPYLTADHRIMLEHADEIILGTELLRRNLGVNRVVMGIESNKPDAIAHMSERVQRLGVNIVVQGLKVKYPQGAEKQLIKAVTGREVPSGALPIEVGCVVNNVATAKAAYDAYVKGIPLVERVVTVTGRGVKQPGNYLVRVGTPLQDVIDAAGGFTEDAAKVILGGPMMGKAAQRLDIPVTKGTGGILVLPAEEAVRGKVESCIRCGRCVNVCPMGLEPYLLQQLSEMKRFEDAERRNILDCVECGSCSYTCPSNRPLVDFIRLGKAAVIAAKRKGK